MSNLTEFNCAKAAGCASRRTDANAASLYRGQRIIWYAVLVARDCGALKRFVKVMPDDYARVLAERAARDEEAAIAGD